jgi:hypothetical protein
MMGGTDTRKWRNIRHNPMNQHVWAELFRSGLPVDSSNFREE